MRTFGFIVALIVVIISMTVFSSARVLALPEDGLVLYYAFDGGSVAGDTARDLSGQGNDGKINGEVKAVAGGLEFNGADSYVVTDALDARTGANKSFTVLCWFKTDESSNGPLCMWGDNPTLGSSGGRDAPIGWRSSTGNFAAGFYAAAHIYAEAGDSYADDKFHFVAQVGEEEKGHLYVDGAYISSTDATWIYPAQPYFYIGAVPLDCKSDIDDIQYYKGVIGRIAVYSVVLNEEAISAIAREWMAVYPSGKLTAVWGHIKIAT